MARGSRDILTPLPPVDPYRSPVFIPTASYPPYSRPKDRSLIDIRLQQAINDRWGLGPVWDDNPIGPVWDLVPPAQGPLRRYFPQGPGAAWDDGADYFEGLLDPADHDLLEPEYGYGSAAGLPVPPQVKAGGKLVDMAKALFDKKPPAPAAAPIVINAPSAPAAPVESSSRMAEVAVAGVAVLAAFGVGVWVGRQTR